MNDGNKIAHYFELKVVRAYAHKLDENEMVVSREEAL